MRISFIFSILITFVPLALIIGTAVSNSLYFILTIFAIYLYFHDSVEIDKNITLSQKILCVFLIYLALNIFVNQNLDNFGRYIVVLFFFTFIIYGKKVYSQDLIEKKYFFYFNTFVILFLVIDLYYQYFVGTDILGNKIYFEKRLTGPWKEELVPGSFLIKFSIPIFFWLYFF